MNINHQKSYNQVLCDLFEASLNIIKGISSITTSTSNGFTEYRIHSPDNCPGILITYENIRKPESICVYPVDIIVKEELRANEVLDNNYFITSFLESTLSVDSNTIVHDEATLEGEQIQDSDGQVTRYENKCGYYNYFETHDILPSARIIQEPLITDELEIVSKSNNTCTIEKGNKTDGLQEDSEMKISTNSSDKSVIRSMRGHLLNESNCTFFRKNLIQSDIKESQKEQKGYNYEYCDQSFSKSFDQNTHQRTHTGEKRFACNYCGKTFSSLDKMNRHERIHTGKKPYKCNYCGKKFSYSDNKKCHERIHTGEKPYPCTYCNKLFRDAASKMYHERTHTGERPYKCAFCERSFSRSSFQKQHERTHTGEKPYSCNFCGRKFSQSSAKRRHEKIHIRESHT